MRFTIPKLEESCHLWPLPVAGDAVCGDVDADGEEGDAEADPQDHHHHHQRVVRTPGVCVQG